MVGAHRNHAAHHGVVPIPISPPPRVIYPPGGQHLLFEEASAGVSSLQNRAAFAAIARLNQVIQEVNNDGGGACEHVGPSDGGWVNVTIPGRKVRMGELALGSEHVAPVVH